MAALSSTIDLKKIESVLDLLGEARRSPRTVEFELSAPHSVLQRDMIEYEGNVVAFCGRRWGKTQAMVQRIFYHMSRKPGLYWWVGLTWRSASLKRAWREATLTAEKALRRAGLWNSRSVNISAHEIRLPMGEIWFRTAENPTSLAGEGVRGVVMDEFSLMGANVWPEYIRATLLDYGGWVAMVGVPKGRNWAYEEWMAALRREGWMAVHATSYDNPYLSREELDRIKAETPERWFLQEYMAEVVDDGGEVFRKVTAAIGAEWLDEGRVGEKYVIGVDWGRYHDYTAFVVVSEYGEVVHVERHGGMEYSEQRRRLKRLVDKFNGALVVAEDNAMGGPQVEALREEGMVVRRVTMTAKTKMELMDRLALGFERGEVRLVADEELVGELQAYEMERMESGVVRMGAPEGMHDDYVVALALGWWGVDRRLPENVVRVGEAGRGGEVDLVRVGGGGVRFAPVGERRRGVGRLRFW